MSGNAPFTRACGADRRGRRRCSSRSPTRWARDGLADGRLHWFLAGRSPPTRCWRSRCGSTRSSSPAAPASSAAAPQAVQPPSVRRDRGHLPAADRRRGAARVGDRADRAGRRGGEHTAGGAAPVDRVPRQCPPAPRTRHQSAGTARDPGRAARLAAGTGRPGGQAAPPRVPRRPDRPAQPCSVHAERLDGALAAAGRGRHADRPGRLQTGQRRVGARGRRRPAPRDRPPAARACGTRHGGPDRRGRVRGAAAGRPGRRPARHRGPDGARWSRPR